MNTIELSILKLLDSIEITNSKIEQQFKILKEIRVHLVERNSLAISMLYKSHQSI